jgi:hypothetical protein
MNAASPSFMEMELTIGLPCTHFSPASMTSHLEESIITGTTGDVGLGRNEFQEAVHGRHPVDHALVHVDVDDLGAGLDLLPGHRRAPRDSPRLDQLAEARRPGDIGALTDVDEKAVLGRSSAAPSPTGAWPVPASARRAGRCPSTAAAIAAMCSGVVPQHPPTRLTRPACANSARAAGRLGGALVILAEGIGQSRIGIARDKGVGHARNLGDVGAHLRGAQGAVEADGERADVPHRVPEGLGGLAGERAARGVRDGAGDDDRPASAWSSKSDSMRRRWRPWR